MKRSEECPQDLGDIFKETYCIVVLLEGQMKKKGTKSLFKAVMIGNFLIWGEKWSFIFLQSTSPHRLNFIFFKLFNFLNCCPIAVAPIFPPLPSFALPFKRATSTHFITQLSNLKTRVLKVARE